MDHKNPFDGGGKQTTIADVTDRIDRVIKTSSLKKGDTGKSHIYIDGHDLTLTSAQIQKGSGWFTTLYYDAFGKMLSIDKKDWPVFAEYIADIAEPGDLDETNAVMAADILLEQLCKGSDITEDKSVLLDGENCSFFVKHRPHEELFYVVPASAENNTFFAIGLDLFAKSLYDLFFILSIVVQIKLVVNPPQRMTTKVTLF